MPEVRNILEPLVTSASLDRMIKRTGKTVIFPFYHMVSDDPPPHIRHLYHVKKIKEFRSDLECLLKYFRPASPELLVQKDDQGWPSEPAFILSFDDGLREISETIVPILEEKGIKAIFFLNNNFIGNQDLFFRYKVSLIIESLRQNRPSPIVLKNIAFLMGLVNSDLKSIETGLLEMGHKNQILIGRVSEIADVDFGDYLTRNQPYLDEAEIGNILQKGFYIGGHSMDHPSFLYLSPEDQYREVMKSVIGIRERFGIAYSLFSFPFEDTGVGYGVFRRLYGEGEWVLDASFGTSGLKKEEGFPHYQRIPMEKSAAGAEKYLKSEYFYYILKSIAGLNRIKRSG